MSWLQKFYKKLPGFKQLRHLQRAQDKLLHATQENFISNLLREPRYAEPKRLARFEAQVFSQNGEDGILTEIFRRIGVTSRYFVEMGTGSGLTSNTAYWLLQHWTGVWFEGDPNSLRQIRKRFAALLQDGSLQVAPHLLTRENIAGLLRQAQVPPEYDLLSLDIDRNTYWVWAALEAWRPRVVVVEYNATLPAEFDWKVRYDPNGCWEGSAYFGASLKAYELLGRELGYHLVGCDLSGTNAFFVRQDLTGDLFAAPFTAANHYEPARYWLQRSGGHPRCAAFFQERALATGDLPELRRAV